MQQSTAVSTNLSYLLLCVALYLSFSLFLLSSSSRATCVSLLSCFDRCFPQERAHFQDIHSSWDNLLKGDLLKANQSMDKVLSVEKVR